MNDISDTPSTDQVTLILCVCACVRVCFSVTTVLVVLTSIPLILKPQVKRHDVGCLRTWGLHGHLAYSFGAAHAYTHSGGPSYH